MESVVHFIRNSPMERSADKEFMQYRVDLMVDFVLERFMTLYLNQVKISHWEFLLVNIEYRMKNGLPVPILLLGCRLGGEFFNSQEMFNPFPHLVKVEEFPRITLVPIAHEVMMKYALKNKNGGPLTQLYYFHHLYGVALDHPLEPMKLSDKQQVELVVAGEFLFNHGFGYMQKILDYYHPSGWTVSIKKQDDG